MSSFVPRVWRTAVRLPIALVALVIWSAMSFHVAPVLADEALLAVRAAEEQRIGAVERASRATLAIFSANGQGGGSGVVISPDGYALTNFHVTAPCGDHMRCGMVDGKLYDAVIVGFDPTGDVALIKLVGRDDFPVAELADSDAVKVGDWCLVIGNPFLLATNLQPSVSYGIVSGVHRYQPPAGTLLEYADCLQTDAAINPGNSGGPLFDSQGRLIGINGRGSFEKRGRINVGVGYAISINQIKNFLGQLKAGRIVDHATLGATVSTDSQGRVVVSNILRTSDAYRRGLREGDEIVAFGGRPITTVNGFKNALGIFPKGWRVPLSFRRDGEKFDVQVRLAGVHSKDELLEKIRNAPVPEEPAPKPPEPKPGEPGPSEPQPREPKPAPAPRLPLMPADDAPLPEKVAGLIKHRTGFANYYFNEQNRERVWAAHQARGNQQARQGTWKLTGNSAKGKVELSLDAAMARISIAGTEFTLDSKKDLAAQLELDNSTGMLAAFHVWRRLLVMGPAGFGEVTYFGTAPMPNQEGLVEWLEAAYDITESYFWFDSLSGTLLGLEMSPDVGVDPYEVYFDDYKLVQGALFPHRFTIRRGEAEILDFRCEQVSLRE